jgi:hypothetical protein
MVSPLLVENGPLQRMQKIATGNPIAARVAGEQADIAESQRTDVHAQLLHSGRGARGWEGQWRD